MPAATWRQIDDDGWAKTISLESPVVFDPGDVRPGAAFEAVVFPAGASGVLVVESESGSGRVAVASARRVTIPLFNSDPLTVRFDGAPGASLHAARIVSGAGSRVAVKPRRVLLVVVDTLRADAVDSSMPELLDLFADGARFMRAYSPASWTLPATASLLTGKHPTDLALPDGTLVALAPGEPTIASDFAARGFYTAAISANYTVNHENGFSSGSELFLAPSVLDHGDWPEDEWVLDRARRVLEWFPDRDVFLYLHLMNPHDPYRDRESGESLPAPSTGQDVAAGEVERLRAAYRSEARRTSSLLAAFLRDAGPFDQVVVTADHGEELGEHGGFRHGPTVYPEVSRVPLLMRGVGIEPSEIEDPVSIVDLRRFFATDAPSAAAFESDAEVVSFVHAAPRFSWVHGGGQTVLFARDLGEPAAADAIGDWLRANRPALELVAPDGSSRAPTAEEAAAAALRLAQRFHGLGAGQWLWVPGGVEALSIEVEGATGGGWWWGSAGRVELVANATARAEGGSPLPARIEIDTPDPFVLIFVPAIKGGRLSALEGGEVDRLDAPPTTWPPDRAIAWRDPGRPPAALAGVEETMRRLRAQGYL